MPTSTPHDGVARAYRVRDEGPGRPLACPTAEPDDPRDPRDPSGGSGGSGGSGPEEPARLAGQRPLVLEEPPSFVAVPDARLVTVEAGHLVHETRPAAFLAAIGEFGTG
ncbi:alpha/beta fold hydrolase [Streptomyces hydrogenans]|uniref:alpha/beta fold hydrolase n=1 Tax=Streptomyces hydrogenans TaxID=1873719 RepID=UPI0035D5D2E4